MDRIIPKNGNDMKGERADPSKNPGGATNLPSGSFARQRSENPCSRRIPSETGIILTDLVIAEVE